MTAASWEHQLTHYLPWFSTALLGAYVIYKLVRKDQRCEWVNKSIQKDQPKVVNVIDIEDIDKKTVYCRCWRTKTWPFCDGSHVKHNQCTGDNVGPLVLKKETL
ncbi:CDGSH iron-sulfur domain-containing protein 2 homolog B-like [Xenia sp. Carnegie-2017]|uniref:CDGSH iron-sulfur domain-containing protein 2 homolog B-like n=1 Tax=Xenia sp. Carnegie-2017 TaxID=2897299 RepID=UPI001F03B246|nr:CDGSH iron-sulfur domain-containing protein 2 homolog B-like [Xenia sp. Carnegie-2017]